MIETQGAEAPETHGAETLRDPTLIEADDLIRDIHKQEERKDSLLDKNLYLKSLTSTLLRVTEKIAEEEKKESPDRKRLESLYERKGSLTEERKKIVALPDEQTDERYKEVASDMKAAAAETKGEIEEITKLRAQKTSLTDQLANATTDAEKATLNGELAVVEAALEKAEFQGTLEDKEKIFAARIAMGKKAEAMTEAEHQKSSTAADEILKKSLDFFTDSPAEETAEAENTDPDKKKDDKKTGENKTDEEKKAERKVIIHNKIDDAAYKLALALVNTKPKKDDTVGKVTFEAKRWGLMVLTFFGGNPEWTQSLTPEEQKTLGMTVTPVKEDDGKITYSIKWDKIDLSGQDVQDVYEVAFGKDGWTKEMDLLKDDTKFSELQDRAAGIPADTTDPDKLKFKAFVDALESTGARGGTLVKDHINKNADEIVEKLKPKPAPAPTVAATESTEATEEDINWVDVVEKNNFNDSTPVKNVFKAAGSTLESHFSSIDATLTEAIAQGTLPASEIGKMLADSIKTPDTFKGVTEIFAANNELMKSLGLPETTVPEDLIAKATAELGTPEGLSPSIKADVQKLCEAFFKSYQDFCGMSYKALIELQKSTPAYAADKKEVDAVLKALADNNTPATN
ncbi:MAG: hypothetical protein AAB383_05160 [Patescibacteria group bacterium]